jgi:hypothetical protein
MDWNALNDTIAAVFCDTNAVWSHGAQKSNVLLAVDLQNNTVNDGAYEVANSENVVAGCPSNQVVGIARHDQLTFNDQDYTVQQAINDAGWTTLILEKS